MKLYVLYDVDGNIEKSGQCSTKRFEQMKSAGILILEGVGNDMEHRVVNGKIQSKEVIPEVAAPVEFLEAIISQKQWEDVLSRLDKLES